MNEGELSVSKPLHTKETPSSTHWVGKNKYKETIPCYQNAQDMPPNISTVTNKLHTLSATIQL
jgi:hypothetical protein